jgi:hypothetical protein
MNMTVVDVICSGRGKKRTFMKMDILFVDLAVNANSNISNIYLTIGEAFNAFNDFPTSLKISSISIT